MFVVLHFVVHTLALEDCQEIADDDDNDEDSQKLCKGEREQAP